MKKDWEIRKLGDVCEFRRGLTYSKNDEVENSKNDVLRSNNIDLITNQYNDRQFLEGRQPDIFCIFYYNYI